MEEAEDCGAIHMKLRVPNPMVSSSVFSHQYIYVFVIPKIKIDI